MDIRITRVMPDQIPMDLMLLADPSQALIEEYIRRGLCYLAYAQDQIVGEFVLLPTHPQTIEIVNVAVDEGSQGRGIGQALVRKAIQEAKELGYRTIEIGTGNSSFHQLKLYQRCGFRIVGVDLDFFTRNYEEEIYEDGIQCQDMIRLRMEL
ncbi:GNAT family N-acetyltransferase [Paenibacillus sp. PR3]|uniref:GNAT family N-acetyltransferase n=1 Tax=Paenibacillus terricola TaxID=2763503 RepID=A0ABR8N419_9BACL|nr:GNAT family N-acetyltransferase [Paenibacillus terricola]MBD3922147.1 GNAT family N-acetyltransferase [Paenibacillus terricola]